MDKEILKIKELPKTGDTDSFQITVNQMGVNPVSFPITLSGTISAVWGENPKAAAFHLGETIMTTAGSVTQIPQQGFSFDSYNSGDTVNETLTKIIDLGLDPFIKNKTVGFFFGRLLADELFQQIHDINKFFANVYHFRFFRSFDDAFESTEKVIDEMNLPPNDNANYLYRICILANMIDHINVRVANEDKKTTTLNALENWLKVKTGVITAKYLLKTFRMTMWLRKQYPIHEHYDIKSGVKKLRSELETAHAYFEITEPKAYSHNWGVVQSKFRDALEDILNELQGIKRLI